MKIPGTFLLISIIALPLHVKGHGGDNDESPSSAGCSPSWGCFTDASCSNSTSCPFLISWKIKDDFIHFYLTAEALGYVAVGISTSGKMSDSEVYACNNRSVVRAWTVGHEIIKLPEKIEEIVTVKQVKLEDGKLTCEFKRALDTTENLSHFLNLNSPNTYTILAAWHDDTDEGYPNYHGANKRFTEYEVNFSNLTSLETAEQHSEFLPKVHGILMTLAWLGFAATGLTAARYYKPIWPDSTLWGKPVWFSIHRTCMVSAFTCFVVSAVVIVIHVGGYIQPSEGTVRFLHAVLGTTAIILGICNWLMALFRPHPGAPKRYIYNWAHWSVGTLAFYLALATIVLGVVDFKGIKPLLGGIPHAVFWVVILFIIFHLIIWASLQYISMAIESTGRDNDVPLVNGDDDMEKSPINGSVSTSASARMKQLLLWVYMTGVIIAVLIVVIGIVIAS